MKRSGMIGLCFFAVFAFSALGATSALAYSDNDTGFIPTYKECKKVAKGTGTWSDAKCSKLGGTKTYAAANWTSRTKVIKSTSGASTLSSYIKGTGVVGTVTCTKSKDTENIVGPDDNTATVTFEKCKSAGKNCTSLE